MKPVNIDFLPPRRPPQWAWQSLAVVGLGLLAALVMLGLKLQALRALEAEVAVLQAQERALAAALVPASAPPASAPAPWVPPPYDADARRSLQEGQFATATALTQMEQVMVPGATPSSVKLDARTGTVQVQVDFKEQAVVFAYLEALNRQDESGMPARWHLLQVRPVAGGQSQGMAVIVSHWLPPPLLIEFVGANSVVNPQTGN